MTMVNSGWKGLKLLPCHAGARGFVPRSGIQVLTLTILKYGDQMISTKTFFSSLTASFEYLCYGSTAIINV